MSELIPADRRPPLAPYAPPPVYAAGGSIQTESESEGPNLRDVLGVFRRHLFLVLAVAAVVTALTFLFVSQAPPTYNAAAVLRVTDMRTPLTGGLGDPWVEQLEGGARNPMGSHIQVLRSRAVIAEAVDAAGLRLHSLSSDFSVARLQDVQVAPEAAVDTLYLRLASGEVEVTDGVTEVRTAYGEPVAIGGVRFTVPAKPRAESAELVVVPREVMIDRIVGGLVAWSPDKTDVITLQFTDSDPGMAQRVVNAVVHAFQEVNVQVARRQLQRRREFIEEQLASFSADLQAAQRALSDFRSQAQGVSLNQKYAAHQSTLMGLEVQREQLAADVRRYQAVLASLQRPRSDRDVRAVSDYRALLSSPGLAANPIISQLSGQLAGYETEREALTSGPWGTAATHPDIQRLDALIASTEAKLVDALRSHIAGVQSQIATLNDLAARNVASMQDLPAALAEETQLIQQVEAVQRRADMLREEYHRVRITEAAEAGQVQIVDLAGMPATAVPANWVRTLIIGLVLGLALGGGTAFVIETLNTSIRRREEMETVLQVPGLAVIPQITSVEPKKRSDRLPLLGSLAGLRKQNGNGSRGSARELVAVSELRSAEAEAYRTLRTNLIFSQAVQTLQTVVITSTFGEEGKTTTAANLAITFAQQGMRVLLVSADLRRPRLEKMFGVRKEPGLTDVLMGRSSLKEAIHSTAVPELSVLPSGKLPPNPSELLGGQRMRSALDSLSKHFDIIIFDSPPLLAAADASVLGAMADGVLMVVRAGRTDRASAQQAMQQLTAVGARVVGAILNDPDAQVPRYGPYYGYYAAEYSAAEVEEEEEEQAAVSA